MDRKLVAQKKKYFVGDVTLHDISRIIKTREQKMYMVTFQKGAKTKLHYHESGQTLIATEGSGTLEIYKKISSGKSGLKIKQLAKALLTKGDIAYIPRCTLHWHGSANKKTKFSHMAINSHTTLGREAKTVWFDSDFKTFARKIT